MRRSWGCMSGGIALGSFALVVVSAWEGLGLGFWIRDVDGGFGAVIFEGFGFWIVGAICWSWWVLLC
ncbi:hypothetical protein V8C44DRAFT_317087 [Trichoderma aethiopicum]